MKLILIDHCRSDMARLRRALAAELPDIEITEYDAEQQGPPGTEFRWQLYDAAIVSQTLGRADSGLDWIARYRAAAGFPPAILLAEGGDDYLAARAIQRGAFDYLRKRDANGERLAPLLRAAAALTIERRREDAPHDGFPFEECRLDSSPGLLLADGTGHRFVRLIGQGGHSRVYLAERTLDGMTLVLKVLDLSRIPAPDVVARFAREAELVAGIEDPRVVRIYEHGFTADYGYIAMEFFRHGDLKQRVERGVTPLAALRYMKEIALGLKAIHARGIVHRDVKPANVLFRGDDSLALGDFGISRRLHEHSDLTIASGVIGTPSYISPEQALQREVDPRSDLYSAGVVFHELLTGCKPYRADSAAGLVFQHVHGDIPQLPEALGALQPLLEMLLAKDPRDRFASADELLDAVDAWLPARFRAALAGC